MTGVSVGALNAAAVSLFEKGDEVNMAKFLNETWWNLNSDDVFDVHWFPLYHLFHGISLLDNAPLRKTLTKITGGK